MSTEDISNARITLILDNTAKDYVNLNTFNKWRDYIVGDKEVEELSQEDRQRLVKAYNKYRAAPYMWYEKEELGDK